MPRQKYSNGSAISFSKNYKGVSDLNTRLSGSVTGRRGDLNKQIKAELSTPSNRWSAGVSRHFPQHGRPQTSYSTSYRPNKNTEIQYNQSGKNKSLTFTRRF